MKHKIKQVELTDGKLIFYPSDSELIGLDIKTFVIEETMTRDEYERKFGKKEYLECDFCKRKHDPKLACFEYSKKEWYCPRCDKYHDLHHICEMLAK